MRAFRFCQVLTTLLVLVNFCLPCGLEEQRPRGKKAVSMGTAFFISAFRKGLAGRADAEF